MIQPSKNGQTLSSIIVVTWSDVFADIMEVGAGEIPLRPISKWWPRFNIKLIEPFFRHLTHVTTLVLER